MPAPKSAGDTIFNSLEVEGGGSCGTNWPTEILEITTLYQPMKFIESSLLTMIHIWVTLSDFFLHTYFSQKRKQRMAFEKNA
jgi:hypothetical protein